MNQNDLIQSILSAEHQARSISEEARVQRDNMESSIQQEIEELRQRYTQTAEAHLQRFEANQREQSQRRLAALDLHREANLQKVENIYKANRDEWIDAIFQRIVGKAGD